MSSMSVHVPQQARAKVTYEELLSATQKILAQRGIAAVSTNLISSNAGVSPPSFYRYFRNKHEILMALAERLQTLQNNVIQTKNSAPRTYERGFHFAHGGNITQHL